MSKEFVDVLVIGAGPSGCVSSSFLKKNNINVKVVEKTKFPRLVVGESLIPRVMDHFDEAGLFLHLIKWALKRNWAHVLCEATRFAFLISAINSGKAGTGPGRFREPILIIH
jgi:2-polyprenyl-6-methoxyphenol hydroxylase-like FAD-dependent oxidoreductase